MLDDIPFTTFRGQIKQLDTDFRFPIMASFFETCFSAFDDLDRQYAALKEQGFNQFVTAAGSEINFGYRPKRFSGGPGLPPGRYFTVCDGGDFGDRGTLRDELTAYYSGASGLTVTILDPKIEDGVLSYLRTSHNLSEESLAYPLYLYIYRIERRTEKNMRLFEGRGPYPEGELISITYGVRELEAEIHNVIDLRDPETQDWFVRTFVNLELASEEEAAKESRLIFPRKNPIESFGDLLPVIVSIETGGGMIFGQAVGHWLRRHGANALIFPSARSNAFSEVSAGRVVRSGGWNMVVYAQADEPVRENLFGRMATWRDRDHDHIKVQYTAEGTNRGSFSIRGVREFNLLDFDLKKQVSCGIREENPVAQVTGVRNEYLSQMVNRTLEEESKERELWDNDIDYLGFLTWLEGHWRPGEQRQVSP